MNRSLTENMKATNSNITLISSSDMGVKHCWGCRKDVEAMFVDMSTGGWLCKRCMPDVYSVDRLLNSIEGIRAPRGTELTDLPNN